MFCAFSDYIMRTIQLLNKLLIFLTINLVLVHLTPSSLSSESEDIPEEILRTEIILEGRSPLDNQPLSAQEYAEMEAKNQQSPYPPTINSDLQQAIFWLQLLKMIRTLKPF
jgi:hypothetical protein